MATVTFDTLKFANRLKAAGAESRLTEVKAKAIAEAFAEQQTQIEKYWTEKQTATKTGVAEICLEIERLRAETRQAIAEAKNDMLKWGAGMLLAQAGLIAVLVKLL